MIEIKNLGKKFRKKQVLNDVNFIVKKGEVLGILGPNGSGKTTLLKIICGLVKPSRGKVITHGVRASQIATVFEDHHFLDYLSGKKNMQLFLGAFLNANSVDWNKLFKQYGLSDSIYARFRIYSSGMKRRLDLMSAFTTTDKSLYLLDEPTNTLDIDSILSFNRQVISLKNEGKTVIISSHHSEELEKLCDRFLIMKDGKLIVEIEKEEITSTGNSLENKYSTHIIGRG